MIWLAVHMWFLLIVAFAIGVGTGLWIRRDGAPSPKAKSDAPRGTLEIDAPKPAEFSARGNELRDT